MYVKYKQALKLPFKLWLFYEKKAVKLKKSCERHTMLYFVNVSMGRQGRGIIQSTKS